MASKRFSIISVTGTKGKTTVVNLVASILRDLGHATLHVDTTGHFINGRRRSTIDDSKRIWGLKTPSMAPGRYLGELLYQDDFQGHSAVILECSFSCSKTGLGYRHHDVGVFLNVFDDHIDPGGRIASKQDLAAAKSFIFSSLKDGGWAVFNADDPFVCSSLAKLSTKRKVNLLPCGMTFDNFDIRSHLDSGGVAIGLEGSSIILLEGSEQTVICDAKKLPWTFEGSFLPSVWNLMHTCATLYAFYNGAFPKNTKSVLEGTRLDSAKGRLVVRKTKTDITIVADYAHEKVSLVELGRLARTLTRNRGRVLGVVRLSHERSDRAIRDTGHAIAEVYDALVVYDKIDGFWRKPAASGITRYPQITGRTSRIFADAIAEHSLNAVRIIREDNAINHAASIARPGDVVVIIVNDDIERSLKFIQDSFGVDID